MRRLLVLLACVAAFPAAAQYPAKPIRFVIPFPPGGGTDTNSRALTARIARNTGWTFVMDNKPGAGGNIGAEQAAKAAPDGYTLVLGQTSNLAINPFLYAKPPFDPLKDFEPVALVSSVPLVIVAGARRNGGSPISSIRDLIEKAKANPGGVTYASPGNGTVGHLAGELIARIAGVKLLHVPYKGAGPALAAAVGGEADLSFPAISAALPQVNAGRLRALAITSGQRSPLLSQVPTIAESGYPDYVFTSWVGILAPAATPSNIVSALNGYIVKAMRSAAVSERLAADGTAVIASSPEEFQARIKSELARWAKVVKASGIKAD